MTEGGALRDGILELLTEARADGEGDEIVADVLAAGLGGFIRDAIAQRETELRGDGSGLFAASVVGGATGNPAVQIEVNGQVTILDVAAARKWAFDVIQAAEAAVHDASVMRWLQVGAPGLDQRAAMMAISELRRYRGDTAERKEPSRDEEKDG